MSFSKEDAEKVKKHFRDEIMKYFAAKDAKGLTSLYHPDAVLIHQGNWCAYGIDEIQKKNDELINMPFDFDIKEKEKHFDYTSNGRYVVAKYESKDGFFVQMYMKDGKDGKYFIIHDIFNM